MRQQMFAELIFDHPHGRDLAVVELTKQGFKITVLDWTDPGGTPTTWVEVRGVSELSQDDFLAEMGHLASQFSGDVIEAGLEFPPESPAAGGEAA
jgi:hypothetical protein